MVLSHPLALRKHCVVEDRVTAPPETSNEADKGANLASIAAAATTLIAGVGLLTLTGVLGRVQRNHGEAFPIALAVAMLGAAIWLIASLISTKARTLRQFGLAWASARNCRGSARSSCSSGWPSGSGSPSPRRTTRRSRTSSSPSTPLPPRWSRRPRWATSARTTVWRSGSTASSRSRRAARGHPAALRRHEPLADVRRTGRGRKGVGHARRPRAARQVRPDRHVGGGGR